MNIIDNGIKKVLSIVLIENPLEVYFKVKFIDWYGAEKTKRFMSIKDLEKKQWTE